MSAPGAGRIRAYRIRWTDGDGDGMGTGGGERQVCAAVDHATRWITLYVPGAEPVDVDVVAARAASMVLSDAVYRSLQPSGPLLAVEADAGDGFRDLGEVVGS